ncbi:MAG TPA: metal-dependent hydrolase, partial [Thermoplasmata archaeon]|nr:metal-dependent hydrolase [Thermoplasmata archaeon]
MYLLGHLGIGLGIAWLASTRTKRVLDYRLVLLGAILPDLVDKPLGYLLGLESRLWAHTLVFLGSVLLVSAVPSVRVLASAAVGIATHLLLDRMWEQPWVFVWPALGATFPSDGVNLFNILRVLVEDPIV